MSGLTTLAWNIPSLLLGGMDTIDALQASDRTNATNKLYGDIESDLNSRRRTRATVALAAAMGGAALGYKLKSIPGAIMGGGIAGLAGYYGAKKFQKAALLPLVPIAVAGTASATPVITRAALALLAYYGPQISENILGRANKALADQADAAEENRNKFIASAIRSRNMALNESEQGALKALGGAAAGGLTGYLAGSGINKALGYRGGLIPALGALAGTGIAGYLGKDKILKYIHNM